MPKVIYTHFVVGLLRYSFVSSCSNLGLGAYLPSRLVDKLQ